MTDNDNNQYFTKGVSPGQFGDLVVDMEESKGIFTAVFSVFNLIDGDKDRVLPGYFKKQIEAGILPKSVWAHDKKQPIGRVLEWGEFPENHPGLSEGVRPYGGLRATVQLNMEKQLGRDAFSDIHGGFIDQYSFGSYPRVMQKNLQLKCRDLIEGHTIEVSPVLEGAMPLTYTECTKSLDKDVDIEVYTWVDLQYELVKARLGEQYARNDD